MTMLKRKDGSYSKRGLWDNIRANKGSGKKPTKQMLEQENKINNETKKTGGMVKKKKKSMYKTGGFPDLSGDGKVTQKDILMGKGVIKKKKKKKGGKAPIPMRYRTGGFLEPGIENLDNL
tara:strand:+ start:1121 stop:1480 length:360 start_codon:yes stop_codon:yes gene_type:complete